MTRIVFPSDIAQTVIEAHAAIDEATLRLKQALLRIDHLERENKELWARLERLRARAV